MNTPPVYLCLNNAGWESESGGTKPFDNIDNCEFNRYNRLIERYMTIVHRLNLDMILPYAYVQKD